jgi:NAD(P)-dependent dehydrogenase (short-subunit alcohol dehydrogenase family)
VAALAASSTLALKTSQLRLARANAEHNVTINNLLPGTFDTDRLKSNL